MKELSLHILDIAENGITAGADYIRIEVDENRRQNRLRLVIEDNGRGIAEDRLYNITDPFNTTRTTRRVGLGLSLLENAAERCEGTFDIRSAPGKGTCVTATFRYDHIDRAPVGDMAGTFTTLVMGNPEIAFDYRHRVDGEEFSVDTREIAAELGNSALSDPVVIHHLTRTIREALGRLRPGKEENGKADH